MGSDDLTVENLYELDDNEVKQTVKQTFIAQMKHAASVHDTFFGTAPAPPQPSVHREFVDKVICSLISSSLSRTVGYGFGQTIDQQKADASWRNLLNTPEAVAEGQALYHWAFPEHCKAGGHDFAEYATTDRLRWGKQLADHVVTDAFINGELNKLISGLGDWETKLNLVFYKISCLDQSQVRRVRDAWKNACGRDFEIRWPTYNYLLPYSFKDDEFLGEVNTAISVDDHVYYPSFSLGASGASYGDTYGVKVVEFLSGGAAALGLTTGIPPTNTAFSVCTMYGCTTHWSTALTASGSEVPMPKLRSGHALLARHGAESRLTSDRLGIMVSKPLRVYGINDLAPFFTAEVSFWSPGGWKTLLPDYVAQLNPDLHATTLVIGDTIYRVTSVDPLTYEEIRIDKFTSQVMPVGSKVYRPVIDHQPTYHVNGFCVTLNYPFFTAQRLQEGLDKLGEDEKRQVIAAITPIMPLLIKALGDFVEAPVLRALGLGAGTNTRPQIGGPRHTQLEGAHV